MSNRLGPRIMLVVIALAAFACMGVVCNTAPVDPQKSSLENLMLVDGPAIEIHNLTNGEDANDPPGPTVAVGDAVNWTYEVTNIGNVALSGIEVTDDQGVAVICPKDTLESGESMTCTATGTAAAGQYENVGTVTASDDSSNVVTASDASHYLGEENNEEPVSGGCGLGFWKNHPDAWAPTGHSPDDALSSLFSGVEAFEDLAELTLGETLLLHGGPTVEDAAGLLLKHAVPAVLNAAHPDLGGGLSVEEIVELVNAALESGDRQTILHTKSQLAQDDVGGCSLSPDDDEDDGDEDDGDEDDGDDDSEQGEEPDHSKGGPWCGTED